MLSYRRRQQPSRAGHGTHAFIPALLMPSAFWLGRGRTLSTYTSVHTSSVSLIWAPHIREQCRLQCVFPYTILPLAVSDRTDLAAPQAGRTPAWLTDRTPQCFMHSCLQGTAGSRRPSSHPMGEFSLLSLPLTPELFFSQSGFCLT